MVENGKIKGINTGKTGWLLSMKLTAEYAEYAENSQGPKRKLSAVLLSPSAYSAYSAVRSCSRNFGSSLFSMEMASPGKGEWQGFLTRGISSPPVQGATVLHGLARLHKMAIQG